ncbi:MAG: hypothetical protein MJ221_02340 [Bacilli bacterium]|nr:hypothetical protein [Bacilli bacterium]
MKKIFKIVPLLLIPLLIGGCNSEAYHPSHGGVVDTLHNEVHVADYETLVKSEFEHAKDPTKTYYTDDDGLKFKWNGTEYVCISEYDTTINFYFDSTQTTDANGLDCPIFTIKWFMLKPLGACPEEIDSKEKVLAIGETLGFTTKYDFTNFLGFSAYSSCLGDKGHMWDFTKDYRQQAVTNLYGIWVD